VLLDRMRIVRVPDISTAERKDIVRSHILPRMEKVHNIRGCISDDAMDLLTCPRICGEHGMRGVEKVLEGALMQANVRVIKGTEEGSKIEISPADVEAAAKMEDGSNHMKRDDAPSHMYG
jgi:ATP-dependent Lon protease